MHEKEQLRFQKLIRIAVYQRIVRRIGTELFPGKDGIKSFSIQIMTVYRYILISQDRTENRIDCMVKAFLIRMCQKDARSHIRSSISTERHHA